MTYGRGAKASAQSLGEYGIIIALISVVCMSALILLGPNISTLLGNVSGALGQNQNLTAKPSSSPAVTAVDTTTVSSSSGTVTAPQPMAVSVQMDKKSGQIQLSNLENASGGKVITSSQGTKLAGLALLRLSQTATTNNGEPPDPVSLALIKQLAEFGQQMAAEEASLKLPPSTDPSSAAYAEYYNSGLSQQGLSNFLNTYDKLQQLIGNNPNYSNIMQQVNDYTGIATEITVNNYVKSYLPLAPSDIAQASRGTDITTKPLSVEFSPADIQAAMGQMAQLASP